MSVARVRPHQLSDPPDADWLWFMTWHTRWLTGSDQNTPELLKQYFASDRYITKGELPGWLKA